MPRALLTGGAGFIGSHLAEELLRTGWTVEVIDNLSTGSIENIAALRGNRCFSYVIDDIFNRPLMAELVDKADVVFHLAAAVGVRLIVKDPVRTMETNIKGTELVLELAAKKLKKVVIASSSEVYGKSDKESFSEEDDLVLGPTSKARWCYAATKIVDEFLAKAYFKQYSLPVIVVRMFNIVGPRQTGRYGMVIPNFVEQALSGRPITVYGDGQQTRSFMWVGDAVRAILRLAEHPKAVGEVLNVGHPQPVTILELAKMVKAMTRSPSEIVLVPYGEAYAEGFDDMRKRVPDISKLRQLISFSPTHDLKKILREVIAYWRAKLGLKGPSVRRTRGAKGKR